MGAESVRESFGKRFNQLKRETIFIGMPALVTSIEDYETYQCVNVLPIFNDIYPKHNDTILESQVLKKVFVLLPTAGNWSIKFPVSVGDKVTLNWSHKDLGTWLDSDGDDTIDQSILEDAGLEDCWVELAGGTRKNHQNPSKDNFIIEGPETTITITPEGNVTMVTSGTTSLTSSGHTINADTQINGSLTVSDVINAPTIEADTSLTVASKEVDSHNHTVTEGDTVTGDL